MSHSNIKQDMVLKLHYFSGTISIVPMLDYCYFGKHVGLLHYKNDNRNIFHKL